MSGRQAAENKAQTILAPSQEAAHGEKSIFLAGTTSQIDGRNWRQELVESLLDQSVTFYDPYRRDWDSTWREDINFGPYREQVEWELEKQEAADIVVVYFDPVTEAPISLLELGLCARTGKAIVACPEGYKKRGNVQIVCAKHGIRIVDGIGELREAILERLHAG